LKIALVLDWPSIDAAPGHPLSEWEWKVTQELMQAATFKPDYVGTAFRAYTAKWPTLFTDNKPGGPLTQLAEADRAKLHADLQGYDMALTMGPHAMFCLTGETKIDTFRGTHIDSPFVPGLQVVPTYSPTIFARMAWAERPVVVSSMRKALRRYTDQDRTIYIPETLDDLQAFEAHIGDQIVFDVETNKACRITEFSVAPSSGCCLYVQLEDRNYRDVWPADFELGIWTWLWKLASRTDLAWGFHNATYDLTYLDAYGIRPKGPIFDTMLRHHAWQPEWEKSLGFLASLHIPTRAWKHLRTKAKKDFNKTGAID
jgi:hypothetical protein